MPRPNLHQWPKEMPADVRALATNNPPKEGAIQLLAWLVRVVKVREVGVNAGYWVLLFLGAAGLGAGYAWCAALQLYVNILVGLPYPSKGGAAVLTWLTWGRKEGRLIPVSQAKRGDLLLKMYTPTTGHMGRKLRDGDPGRVVTFEGNTSSGTAGSQREGDGAFEKDRTEDWWDHAVSMTP